MLDAGVASHSNNTSNSNHLQLCQLHIPVINLCFVARQQFQGSYFVLSHSLFLQLHSSPEKGLNLLPGEKGLNLITEGKGLNLTPGEKWLNHIYLGVKDQIIYLGSCAS